VGYGADSLAPREKLQPFSTRMRIGRKRHASRGYAIQLPDAGGLAPHPGRLTRDQNREQHDRVRTLNEAPSIHIVRHGFVNAALDAPVARSPRSVSFFPLASRSAIIYLNNRRLCMGS